MRLDRPRARRLLADAQAAYYVATGLWPVVHLRSFYAVTGPKTDHWLVRLVGLLVTVIGVAVALAARRAPAVAAVLGGGAAAALLAIDLHGRATAGIRAVYLVDAALEAALVAGWAALARGGPGAGGGPRPRGAAGG